MNDQIIEIPRAALEALLVQAFHIGVQTVYEHARTASKNELPQKVAKSMVDRVLSGEEPTEQQSQ